MTTVTVQAGTMRVPEEARRALAQRLPVRVRSHTRAWFVMVPAADYDEFLAPVYERLRRGLPVPIDQLLTDDDFAVLADRDEDDVLADGILEAWND